MPMLTPDHFEERLASLEASYQRQLSLIGKPGYDPLLTIKLKDDLDWLIKEQQQSAPGSFIAGNK